MDWAKAFEDMQNGDSKAYDALQAERKALAEAVKGNGGAPRQQPAVKKVFKPLSPDALKAELDKLVIKPCHVRKPPVPKCGRYKSGGLYYQFVLGNKRLSKNIFPVDAKQKPYPPFCSQAELDDIIQMCEPLNKIMYVKVSAMGFSSLRGLNKVPPVGQALLQKYPQYQFFIQPVCVEAMFNKRWEHFVTIESRT